MYLSLIECIISPHPCFLNLSALFALFGLHSAPDSENTEHIHTFKIKSVQKLFPIYIYIHVVANIIIY